MGCRYLPASAARPRVARSVASYRPSPTRYLDLLGGCSVAGCAELVYGSALANNGWGRQSQYDASAAVALVLAP